MARPARRVPVPRQLTEYWAASQAPRYSILFAMPLLIAYEALAAFLSSGQTAELRNGADVLLRELFLTIAGQRFAPLVFGLTVIGLSAWLIGRDLRGARTALQPWIFLAMLAEAAVLAVCFGTVVGWLASHIVGVVEPRSAADAIAARWSVAVSHPPAWLSHLGEGGGIPPGGTIASAPTATKVMLALGAGVYEELVFRVLLVSAISFLARRLFAWRPSVSAGVAVGISALIFAAFHYIGPYGDPLRLDSFVFRFIGGLAFSVLYVARGFGITAWTHAIYDLLALVV